MTRRLLLGSILLALLDSCSARRVQTKVELMKMEQDAQSTTQEEAKKPPRVVADCKEGECGNNDASKRPAKLLATLLDIGNSIRRNSSIEELIGKWIPGDKPAKFDVVRHSVAIAVCFFGVLVFVASLFTCTRLMLFRRPSKNRKQYKHKGRVIYEWQQFEDTMMMYIELPSGVDQGKLDIRISPRHIRIGLKGKNAFLKEELFLAVDEVNSYWKVNGRELEVCLFKEDPEEWKAVLLPHVEPESKSS